LPNSPRAAGCAPVPPRFVVCFDGAACVHEVFGAPNLVDCDVHLGAPRPPSNPSRPMPACARSWAPFGAARGAGHAPPGDVVPEVERWFCPDPLPTLLRTLSVDRALLGSAVHLRHAPAQQKQLADASVRDRTKAIAWARTRR
jgi:hypothetical protein